MLISFLFSSANGVPDSKISANKIIMNFVFIEVVIEREYLNFTQFGTVNLITTNQNLRPSQRLGLRFVSLISKGDKS